MYRHHGTNSYEIRFRAWPAVVVGIHDLGDLVVSNRAGIELKLWPERECREGDYGGNVGVLSYDAVTMIYKKNEIDEWKGIEPGTRVVLDGTMSKRLYFGTNDDELPHLTSSVYISNIDFDRRGPGCAPLSGWSMASDNKVIKRAVRAKKLKNCPSCKVKRVQNLGLIFCPSCYC